MDLIGSGVEKCSMKMNDRRDREACKVGKPQVGGGNRRAASDKPSLVSVVSPSSGEGLVFPYRLSIGLVQSLSNETSASRTPTSSQVSYLNLICPSAF